MKIETLTALLLAMQWVEKSGGGTTEPAAVDNHPDHGHSHGRHDQPCEPREYVFDRIEPFLD